MSLMIIPYEHVEPYFTQNYVKMSKFFPPAVSFPKSGSAIAHGVGISQ